jgi:ATP-dependent Clp protease protease subunit
MEIPKRRWNSRASKKTSTEFPVGPQSAIHDSVWQEYLDYRQIILNGEIGDEVIERVVMQIEKYNFEDEERESTQVGYNRLVNPITLYINSPGGYVTEGLAIVSAIEQSGTPIITVAVGNCASMAFVILVAGHARYAYRHAHLMYHEISSGYGGTLHGFTETVEHLGMLQKQVDSIILGRSLVTAKKLASVNNLKHDWYLTLEEALGLGFIDGVVPQPINPGRPKRKSK